MKSILILLACLPTLVANGQARKNIPPGFEWVKNRGLLVSTTEVTLKQWADFITSTDDPKTAFPECNPVNKKCICDQDEGMFKLSNIKSVVYRDTSFIEVGSKTNKKTRGQEFCINMPITGISLEQAEDYAKWLTEYYSMNTKYADLQLEFRLPTPDEMESLLSDTFSRSRPGEDLYDSYKRGINSHGCAIYNHAHNSWCDNNKNMKLRYGYGVPMEVNLFFPDVNGLYDLQGNVAEMTSEPGVSMGGSCIHTAEACQPGAKTAYNYPEKWLGFRLVAELK
jgi:formylglycine-generating enzyme required for sulfatase activity